MTDTPLHPSDDDLVLLFYGELPGGEQAYLRAHVDACGDCRTSYNALTRTLHLASTFQAPEPGPDFETRAWARLAPALDTTRHASRWWLGLGSWAAVLLLATGAGWLWTARTPDAPAGPTAPGTNAGAVAGQDPREGVLLAALDGHLVQAEMLFVELLNAPANESGAFTYARNTADDLVASGRLYRETARDTGASQLVAVLDELELVLVEVARSRDIVDPGDLRALRGRIEQDDLLFKVRAVSADIQDRQDGVPSSEGAL